MHKVQNLDSLLRLTNSKEEGKQEVLAPTLTGRAKWEENFMSAEMLFSVLSLALLFGKKKSMITEIRI